MTVSSSITVEPPSNQCFIFCFVPSLHVLLLKIRLSSLVPSQKL